MSISITDARSFNKSIEAARIDTQKTDDFNAPFSSSFCKPLLGASLVAKVSYVS